MPFLAPERAGFLRRRAPEMSALLVYAVFAITALLASDTSSYTVLGGLFTEGILLRSAVKAYALAGALLVVFPLGAAASALAVEKDRNTFDSLLLIPHDVRKLVFGRFLRIALSWTRFMLYLTPLYVLMSASPIVHDQVDKGGIQPCLVCSFLPKPGLLFAVLSLPMFERFSWSVGGLLLAGLRALNDLSVLIACIGVGIFISARARSVTSALVWSYLLVPPALISILSLDTWALIGFNFGFDWLNTRDPAYCLFAPLAMAIRLILTVVLVRAAARRFTSVA